MCDAVIRSIYSLPTVAFASCDGHTVKYTDSYCSVLSSEVISQSLRCECETCCQRVKVLSVSRAFISERMQSPRLPIVAVADIDPDWIGG